MNVLIIAEAGVNHNGDLNLAKQLVSVAANAGADYIKFQTFVADRLATPTAPKADYQIYTTGRSQSQQEMLKQLELTNEMHEVIMECCRAEGIGFLSTGFDIESNKYLYSLDISVFKIPSGEITNLPYLRNVGSFGKSIILSTGMSTLGEIEAAIEVLETSGTPRDRITVLHCNTEYPTPMNDVNLRCICSIRKAFGVNVGFSDHTLGIEAPIAAVALGATVIEKHLTLDRGMSGPDHRASLEPNEFSSMVRAIRNIEIAMGDGIKRPSLSERGNISAARKSLVASRPIQIGECFSMENITAKRPANGISPMRIDEVLGRTATRYFEKDDCIEI